MTDPLIDALRASSSEEDAPGWTTNELAAQTGLTPNRVRMRLRELAAEGRLRYHRVRRLSLGGRMMGHITYELVDRNDGAGSAAE